MPDLYSEIGQNARRTIPSSEFGTPKITPVILLTNGETLPSGNTVWAPNDSDEGNYLIDSDFRAPNSDIFKVVRAVQEFCEVYEVGCTSDSSILTVMVRDSSIPYDAGDTFQNVNNVITKLQTAAREALDGALVTAKIGRIKDDDTEV
jgi:hypothetical protein